MKNMDRDYLFFDLDGTLADPRVGITCAVQYALRAMGIRADDTDALTPFIGPPLRDCFRQHFGLSAEDTERAVTLFREYYTEKGIYENEIYDGIPELLRRAQAAGYTLVVATSKMWRYAERIVQHFGLAPYLSCVAGSEPDGTRSDKDEVILYALERLGISDKTRVVMIGDRSFDILGARRAGLESIGVLYGYGSERELRDAGADYIVPDVASLTALLLK